MTGTIGGIDELAGVAMGGNSFAVGQLLAAVQPLVLRYCRARIGRQDRAYASADDVAQEACYAVLKALPTYRDQGRPFLAFVYGIAAHKVADAHRSAARNKAEPVPDVPDLAEPCDGPEQLAVNSELTGTVGRLMEALPAKQREILVLRVVVGLSAEETADAVGSTPGAVRVAQHRALNRLRQLVTQQPTKARVRHADQPVVQPPAVPVARPPIRPVIRPTTQRAARPARQSAAGSTGAQPREWRAGVLNPAF